MKISHFSNPAQTILLTTRANGRDNVMAMDWHMPLSFEPMLYGVSVGKTRYTLELVRASKVFVVNFVPKELSEEVKFCGRNSGKDMDKFAAAKLAKEEAETIDCPRIKQALAFLECRVLEERETGDHILFIAEVTKADLKKEGKRLFHVFGDDFTTTEA